MKQKTLYAKRKKVLAQSGRRYSHNTVAGLEDALAVALDIIQILTGERPVITHRMKRLIEILRTLRLGPYAYDKDSPAQVRFSRRIAYEKNKRVPTKDQ